MLVSLEDQDHSDSLELWDPVEEMDSLDNLDPVEMLELLDSQDLLDSLTHLMELVELVPQAHLDPLDLPEVHLVDVPTMKQTNV